MSDYIVRVPLRNSASAERFERMLGDFLAELRRAQEPRELIGVRTELKDGAQIKSVMFETRDQVLHFLSFWKSRYARIG